VKIKTEIAKTPSTRERGLQFRDSLDENSGMFFVFEKSRKLCFWMMNTKIPLEILFISDDFEILDIKKMTPFSLDPVMSHSECRYALELNDGFCKKNGIEIGDFIKVDLDKARVVEAQLIKKIKEKVKETTKKVGDFFNKKKEEPLNEKLSEMEEEKEEREIIEPQEEEEKTEEDILPEEVEELQDQKETGPFDRKDEPEFINTKQQEIEDKKDEFPESDPLYLNNSIEEIIKFSDQNNYKMSLLYKNSHGTVLPPKTISKIPNEGYILERADNGPYFKGFDESPTIKGDGWVIEGNKIKSFLFSRIINLEPILE
jgi:uncharacterized membrane protein (UPF0127 family)